MIVVKLGGSLYSSPYLKEWVDNLASVNNQTMIIVPGGGPFADQVRKASSDWDLDDEVAHEMATLAMQQFALLISSLNQKIKTCDSIDTLVESPKYNVLVWLPYHDVITRCHYPKSWRVTSDSLSLWLANALTAEKLLLVKSAKVNDSINNLISSDVVDEYFSTAINEFSGEINFYHASQSKQCINDLNNNG